MARAIQHGRSAGAVLLGGAEVVEALPEFGPGDERVPRSRVWVVLRAAPWGSIGIFNRFWRGAAPEVHDSEGLLAEGTVLAGWPSMVEAQAYCHGARRPMPPRRF